MSQPTKEQMLDRRLLISSHVAGEGEVREACLEAREELRRLRARVRELEVSTRDGRTGPVPADFPAAVQKIASICGELSLGGCGIAEYRAVWPQDGDPAAMPRITTVPPESVEGIFTAIYLRLIQTRAYQPLAAAEKARGRAERGEGLQRERAEAAEQMLATFMEALTAEGEGDQAGGNRSRLAFQQAGKRHSAARVALNLPTEETTHGS